MKEFVISVLLWSLALQVFSQDFSNLSEKKPLELGGNVTATSSFYHVEGKENRRDPLFWQINANLDVKIFGNSVPFSFTYSNQESSFSQPYNQFGFSPKYKWVTAHIGYRSMNFSTYTLSGNRFFGGGVEAAPPELPIEVKAMYGRLNKGINPADLPPGVAVADMDPASGPAYDRWGGGAKIKYTKKFGSLEFIAFKAADRPGSIFVPDSIQNLQPAENLVLGFNADVKIDDKTTAKIEFARSYYTRNISLPDQAIQSFTFADNLGPLLKANTSTSINNAITAQASRNFGMFELNAKYKRVDPNYQSMGSPFLNNDLQNITGGVAFSLFKNKVTFAADAGVQKDNIDDLKEEETQRIIVNGNINVRATKKLNFTLSGSNFTTNSYQTGVVANDTLQFYQITRNLTLSTFYTISSGSIPQSIFLTISRQETSDAEDNASEISNFNLGYTIALSSIGMTGNVSINYFRNDINPILTNGIGPTLQLSKAVLKDKGNVSLSYSNAQTIVDGERNSDVHTISPSFNVKLFKTSTLGIQASVVNQQPVGPQATGFTELRGNVSYSYNF